MTEIMLKNLLFGLAKVEINNQGKSKYPVLAYTYFIDFPAPFSTKITLFPDERKGILKKFCFYLGILRNTGVRFFFLKKRKEF